MFVVACLLRTRQGVGGKPELFFSLSLGFLETRHLGSRGPGFPGEGFAPQSQCLDFTHRTPSTVTHPSPWTWGHDRRLSVELGDQEQLLLALPGGWFLSLTLARLGTD